VLLVLTFRVLQEVLLMVKYSLTKRVPVTDSTMVCAQNVALRYIL
jgi:hypothetical protein